MYKYMFNYVILIFIFLLTDIFINYTPSFFNILCYLPTITMLGNGNILVLIPYTYLIVKYIFIKKVNHEDNDIYSIKKQIIINVTVINVISTIIESLLLNNAFIWIVYTFLITMFLMILKTDKEKQSQIINKNINEYFKNNRK